jgi:heme exporter protein C
MTMQSKWWKILGVALVLYSIVFGFLGNVPARPILNETIRNIYFHVPLWFAMFLMQGISLFYSIYFLNKSNEAYDTYADKSAVVAVLLGILGCVTGSIWAKYTWGAWWTKDVKLNGAAIGVLIYVVYLILRNSIQDQGNKGRIAAVYNIFAFVLMIVFIWILPRINDSLHPGNGDNPAFNQYGMAGRMRLVFYPAVIGWMLISVWIGSLLVRIKNIKEQLEIE